MTFLDTHALIWLVTGESDKFDKKTLDSLQRKELFVSPMVLLEIEYLHEIKRLKYGADRFLEIAAAEGGVQVAKAPFAYIIHGSLLEHWTRDPFDRIIVAQARLNKAPLLTLDRVILKNYHRAYW